MGAWRFCFSVGSGAPGAALVVEIQISRRAGLADDRGMDGRGTPSGPGPGTPQVRNQTRPFYPQGIRLNGGEGSVDGSPLLGCQMATGTQIDPTRRKSGKR